VLQNYDWELPSDTEAGGLYLRQAMQGNPNVQLYVYNIWPNNPDAEWNNPPEQRTIAHSEGMMNGIYANNPTAKKPIIIPGGACIYAIGKLADQHNFEGLNSRMDLFAPDDIGHMGIYGSFVIQCAMYACMFKEDPAVLANVAYADPPDNNVVSDIPEPLATNIKTFVWNYCRNYAPAGIGSGAVVINTASLPNGFTTKPYQVYLSGNGGSGALTWSHTGSLPGGLTLDAATGRISGTPTAVGTFNFTIRLNDTDPQTPEATKALSITIAAPPAPALPATVLTPAYNGVSYSDAVVGSGGTGSLAYALTAGTTPPGLTLAASGVISGTPTTNGTFNFTVTVTDADARTASGTVRIVVAAKPVNGINYSFYAQENIAAMPDFASLSRWTWGTLANFSLTPKRRNYMFAFVFTGYIKTSTAGSYQFFTNSDDGSKLYIDGAQVVGNDGAHTAREVSGSVTLTSGYHAIRVEYWQGNDSVSSLGVSYQPPSKAKVAIPDSVLYIEVPLSVRGPARATQSSLAAQVGSGRITEIYALNGARVAARNAASLEAAQGRNGVYIVRSSGAAATGRAVVLSR
jgi:hypothetical protein